MPLWKLYAHVGVQGFLVRKDHCESPYSYKGTLSSKKAVRVFFEEGDPASENWVSKRLLEILRGKASLVAGGMRR